MKSISRTHFSGGMTAFLDVLGLSERILRAEKDKEISEIISDIEAIQKFCEFRSKDKFVKEAQSLSKKTVLAFSDSVIVNIAFDSKIAKIEGTFDFAMSELSSLALAQGQCVASGFFLRGGVDIGWWYRKSTVLASKSLVGAYQAEGGANVPVIRLSDELYEWASNHPHRKHYSSEYDPVSSMLRKHTGLDRDGKPFSFWYLDYLSVAVESLGWETSATQREKAMAARGPKRQHIREMGYRSNIRQWLRHHARMIRKAHAKVVDDRVKEKYEWLAGYHNEISKKYTTSPLVVCQLR